MSTRAHSTYAIAATWFVAATFTATGCGGSDDQPTAPVIDKTVGVIAYDVAETFEAAGAPITNITDYCGVDCVKSGGNGGGGTGVPYTLGLLSIAEIDMHSFQAHVWVFDSVQNREVANREFTSAASAHQFVSAECGTILLTGFIGGGPLMDRAHRGSFAELEDALAAEFGPC